MALAQKIPADAPELLNSEELATMLGITRLQVGQWVRHGKLPPATAGAKKSKRWHTWIVRGWLERLDRAEKPAPRVPDEAGQSLLPICEAAAAAEAEGVAGKPEGPSPLERRGDPPERMPSSNRPAAG